MNIVLCKPTAVIYDWTVYPFGPSLMGRVLSHPRQSEFHARFQVTSPIIRWDTTNGIVETRNTLYILGGHSHEILVTHRDVVRWIRAQLDDLPG
jgi:hypothetical protein